MRCAVVRRAIRKKENVSVIFFDSEEEAFDFIEKDSENMLQETVDSYRIMEGELLLFILLVVLVKANGTGMLLQFHRRTAKKKGYRQVQYPFF